MDDNYSKMLSCSQVFIENTKKHIITKIPVIGDLITITSDSLAEIEMMRLSDILDEVQQDLENMDMEVQSLNENQQETFILLCEQFIQQVSKELYVDKREAHKNYLVNIIKNLTEGDIIVDEEVIYLDILGRMSHIDLKVLMQISDLSEVDTQTIQIDNISPHLITGAITNLKSFGLLLENRITYHSADERESNVSLTTVGQNFVEYCTSQINN